MYVSVVFQGITAGQYRYFTVNNLARPLRVYFQQIFDRVKVTEAMLDQFMSNNAPLSGAGSLETTIQILDSLGAEGLVITPSEPSETMLSAGAAVGGVSPEVARRVYQVMLQAQD